MTLPFILPNIITSTKELDNIKNLLQEKMSKYPGIQYLENERTYTKDAFSLLKDANFEEKIINTPLQFNPYSYLYAIKILINKETVESFFILYPTFFISGSLLIQNFALLSYGIAVKNLFKIFEYEYFKFSEILEDIVNDANKQKLIQRLINLARILMNHNILIRVYIQ